MRVVVVAARAAGVEVAVADVGDLIAVPAGLDEAVVVAVAGFRAAAVVEERVEILALGFPGEAVGPLGAVDVRRAAVDDVAVRFFSSSETDGWERCEVVEVDVTGRLALAVVVTGRVGGLLRPPVVVLVREVAVAVGLVVVVVVPVVPGRRAAAEGAVDEVFLAAAELADVFGAGDAVLVLVGETGVAALAGVAVLTGVAVLAGVAALAGASAC